MLNALPDVTLSGENEGVLSALEDAHALYAKYTKYTSTPGGAWYGVQPKKFQSYLCSLVASMAPVAGDTRIRGFKEIRWRETLLPALKLLPKVRFVISYRVDVQAQAHSSWYGKQPEEKAVASLETKTRELIEQVRRTGHPYFLLPLESFSVRTFNELLGWLGFKHCWYTLLLHENGGPGGWEHDPRTRNPHLITGKCEFDPARWPSSSHTAHKEAEPPPPPAPRIG